MIQRYRFHISAWKEHFSHWPSVNETFFFQFLSSQWIGSPSQHLKLPPHCGFLIFSPPQIPCVDENWPCAMACLLPMWSDISVKLDSREDVLINLLVHLSGRPISLTVLIFHIFTRKKCWKLFQIEKLKMLHLWTKVLYYYEVGFFFWQNLPYGNILW